MGSQKQLIHAIKTRPSLYNYVCTHATDIIQTTTVIISSKRRDH